MRSLLQLAVMFIALAVGLFTVTDLAVQGAYQLFFPESEHFSLFGSLRIIRRGLSSLKKAARKGRSPDIKK